MPVPARLTWHTCPALWLFFCFAAGIVVAAHGPGLSAAWWLLASFLPLICWSLALCHRRRHLISLASLCQTLALLALTVLAGGYSYALRLALPAHHIAHLAPPYPQERALTVAGTIHSVDVRTPLKARFTLRAEAWQGDALHPATGQLRVTVYGTEAEPAPAFIGAEEVRLTGVLRLPAPRRNPADFDYRAYLARRHIHATLTVRHPALVQQIAPAAGYRTVVPRLRQHLSQQIHTYLPTPEARAIVQALLLGDRQFLGEDVRQQFVHAGLMHLLSVSGLHVLLLGMSLYTLMRPTLMRFRRLSWMHVERTRSAFTLVLLTFYLLITGAAAPVVRAVLMAALFMGRTLLQRSGSPLNVLGVTALLMVAFNPSQLYDPGFQLSYAAVGAILLLPPVLQPLWPGSWHRYALVRWAMASITVSLVATLGTLPVLLYHFGYLSFAGLLLNLVAIPLTTLLLVAGLMVCFCGPWLATMATAYGTVADGLAHALQAVAALGEDYLGWTGLSTTLDNLWMLGATVATLLLVVCWPLPRLRWRWAIVALSLLVCASWQGWLRPAPPLEALFFDIGQGDATLVRLPSGKHILIDAGPRDDFVDAAARTIVPHLRRAQVDYLDAVLITHPHADHMGGLPTILRSVRVGRVLHNGQAYASDLYHEVQHLVDSLAVPYQAVLAGDTLHLDPLVRLQVLAPIPERVASASPNDASVVLLLAYGHTTWLFLGDAEETAEQVLLSMYGSLLASNLIKVGHHGSSTSSTPMLVHTSAQRHSIALVSVAHRNRYRLPSADVIARWRALSGHVWQTSVDGALWVQADGTTTTIVPWRSR